MTTISQVNIQSELMQIRPRLGCKMNAICRQKNPQLQTKISTVASKLISIAGKNSGE